MLTYNLIVSYNDGQILSTRSKASSQDMQIVQQAYRTLAPSATLASMRKA